MAELPPTDALTFKDWIAIAAPLAIVAAAFIGFYGATRANHRLARETDKRRRIEESRTLAIALHAEIEAIANRCAGHATFLKDSALPKLREWQAEHGAATSAWTTPPYPGLTRSVFSANAVRLGTLDDADLITDIIMFHEALTTFFSPIDSLTHVSQEISRTEKAVPILEKIVERAIALANDLGIFEAKLHVELTRPSRRQRLKAWFGRQRHPTSTSL